MRQQLCVHTKFNPAYLQLRFRVCFFLLQPHPSLDSPIVFTAYIAQFVSITKRQPILTPADAARRWGLFLLALARAPQTRAARIETLRNLKLDLELVQERESVQSLSENYDYLGPLFAIVVRFVHLGFAFVGKVLERSEVGNIAVPWIVCRAGR